MPRAKNSLSSEQITLSVTGNVKRYLEALTMDGVYGKNVAETASDLLKEKLRELVKDGTLTKLPPEMEAGSSTG